MAESMRDIRSVADLSGLQNAETQVEDQVRAVAKASARLVENDGERADDQKASPTRGTEGAIYLYHMCITLTRALLGLWIFHRLLGGGGGV